MDTNQANVPMLPATDHDLLIVLHTKLDRALQDIERLGDGISDRLKDLEHTKADKSDVDAKQREGDKIHADHERRIRNLERYVWIAIGALALLELILKASGH